MARRARGSGTAWAVTVVLLGILFVGSTLTAILYYTKSEDAVRRARQAEAKLTALVGGLDVTEADLDAMRRRRPDVSIVQQFRDEAGRLKLIIDGTPAAGYDALVGSLKQKLRVNEERVEDVQVPILSDLIVTLRAELGHEKELTQRTAREATDERQRRLAVQRQHSVLRDAYQKAVTELLAKAARNQTLVDAFRGQVDRRFKELSSQLEQVRLQKDQRINSLVSEAEQVRAENAVLRRSLQHLREQWRTVEGAMVRAELIPDGKIVQLIEDERLVFIDRGRKDRVMLGMTFEVFSRKTGVVKDETGTLRGKGTVEVIDMTDHTAVCRVVRVSPRQYVIQGDVVANLAYDPTFDFKFHVAGDFDVDGVGRSSQTDAKRVGFMIEQWGGKLTDRLSYDTDFLVLGQEPKLPNPPTRDADPLAWGRYDVAMKKYQDHQQIVGEARALRVPILNQNRFMILMGRYER